MIHIFPFFYFQSTYIILFKLSFLRQYVVGFFFFFLIYSANLCLLIGVFRPFTFNVIISMLELECHFIILFLLFFCSSVSFLLTSFLCVTEYILEFHFYLPTMFLSMSLYRFSRLSRYYITYMEFNIIYWC